MRFLSASLVVCALLAGCTSEPVIRTVEVRVPVAAECPAPPSLVRPALPIADLTPESQPADVLRAYAATVEALMGYSLELEELLAGYRATGNANTGDKPR